MTGSQTVCVIVFVSCSAKNPEEAELEDSLNQVVSRCQ